MAPQDLAWHFRDAGLQDIQVNGHLATVSPGDDRLPHDEAQAYALERMERDVVGLQQRWAAHAIELDRAGFAEADYLELLQLAEARISAARSDPSRALRAMEVRVEAMLFVRGTVPLAP